MSQETHDSVVRSDFPPVIVPDNVDGIDHWANFRYNARLFLEFTKGRGTNRLASLDMAARQAPYTCKWWFATLYDQYFVSPPNAGRNRQKGKVLHRRHLY